MKAIFKGNKFVIQWAITDAVTSLPFDFTGMFVDFVLYSDNYHGRISGYTLSGNKMQAEIPANMLPVGVYNIVCEYRTRKENHGHCICRRAFQITRNPEFCTGDDTVTIESFAAPLQLEHMDINYIGHYPSGVSLPDQDRPAWALVGTLKEAKPWFFYTPGSVPPGFQAGWNDMSDVLGTYDLTADKVSIYDFHLLTEYNVSRNHSHTSKVFSTDWSIMRLYFREFADYAHGQTYPACSKVNMPGYTEHSFMANKPTSEAPFKVVEDTNEFTFAEAVDLVPQEYRFAGMRVTFINSMTHQAETWYFKGGTWGNVGNWQKIDFGVGEDKIDSEEAFREKFEMPELTADRAIADEHGNRIPDTYVTRQAVSSYIKHIFNDLFVANPPLIVDGYITPDMLSQSVKDLLASAGATITNLPDEEDLTTIHGVLKFANKRHNAGAYSGLGRQYLRKNLVGGQNLLVQSMMQWPNSIYIVQYDYDLNGAEIAIPEGCTLEFQGGSFSNGTIVGNNTKILSNPTTIFYNINLLNKWEEVFFVEWFGFANDGTPEDTKRFQAAINNSSSILLLPKKYKIGNVTLKEGVTIKGFNTIITPNGKLSSEHLIQLSSNISLSGVTFDEMNLYYPNNSEGWYSYIGASLNNGEEIKDVNISDCNLYNSSAHFINFIVSSGTNSKVKNVHINKCRFSNKGILQNDNKADAVRCEISEKDGNYGEICFENIVISSCFAEYIRTLGDLKRGCSYCSIISCFTHNIHDCHHSIDGSFNCTIRNCRGYMDADFKPATGTNFIEIQGENIIVEGCIYNGNNVTNRGFQITDYSRPSESDRFHISKNIHIIDNFIENCKANGMQLNMESGIVANNVLNNIEYHGISVGNATTSTSEIPARNVIVKDNRINNAGLSYNMSSPNGKIYFFENYENNKINSLIYSTSKKIQSPEFWTNTPHSLISNPYLYLNYETGRLTNTNTGAIQQKDTNPPLGKPHAVSLYSANNATSAVILNDKVKAVKDELFYVTVYARKDCDHNPVIVINERGEDDSWLAYKNFTLPATSEWEQFVFSYRTTHEKCSYIILQILPTGTVASNEGYNSFTELAVSKQPIGKFEGLIEYTCHKIIPDYNGSPYKGQCVFDESLGKPKWYNGIKWVDATGATV